MNSVSQSAVSLASISSGDGPRRSEGMATNANGSPLFVELFFAAFRDEFVAFLEAHREGDRVRVPAHYVLVLGTRR